jgi:hypothetical protein
MLKPAGKKSPNIRLTVYAVWPLAPIQQIRIKRAARRIEAESIDARRMHDTLV